MERKTNKQRTKMSRKVGVRNVNVRTNLCETNREVKRGAQWARSGRE